MPDPQPLLPRGVHQLPVLGPKGEIILIAVTQQHTFFDWVFVPVKDNQFAAKDLLWGRLDQADPVPAGAIEFPNAG